MTTAALKGAIMKAGREALRRRELDSYDINVLDCLMWSCFAPDSRRTAVSYRHLTRLTTVCRDRVIAAVRRFVAFGWIRKTDSRVRVSHSLGITVRQASNIYELVPIITESAGPTAIREQVQNTEAPPLASEGIEKALEGLGRAVGTSPEAEDGPTTEEAAQEETDDARPGLDPAIAAVPAERREVDAPRRAVDDPGEPAGADLPAEQGVGPPAEPRPAPGADVPAGDEAAGVRLDLLARRLAWWAGRRPP